MEKVSIVIPVYNVKRYISRTIDSVLNQTYRNLEIICIDDGSDDGTLDILNQYKKLDNRIVLKSIIHSGVAVARNEGLKYTSGKYLMFVDSDDYISSTAVERMSSCIKENNADVVMFNYISRNPDAKSVNSLYFNHCNLLNSRYPNQTPAELDKFNPYIYKISPVHTCNKIYNRDFVVKNNIIFPENLIYEDVAFWTNVYSKAKKIFYVPENHYYYRVTRKDSIMQIKDERVFDVLKIYDISKQILIDNNLYNFVEDGFNMIQIRDYVLKTLWLEGRLKQKMFEAVKATNIKMPLLSIGGQDLDYDDNKFIQIYRFILEHNFDEFLKYIKEVNYAK